VCTLVLDFDANGRVPQVPFHSAGQLLRLRDLVSPRPSKHRRGVHHLYLPCLFYIYASARCNHSFIDSRRCRATANVRTAAKLRISRAHGDFAESCQEIYLSDKLGMTGCGDCMARPLLVTVVSQLPGFCLSHRMRAAPPVADARG
jgi:hypothetical protein